MSTNGFVKTTLRCGLGAVIALAAMWAPPAAARFHQCKAAYMLGTTRYEYNGSFSSPIFNMVNTDSDIWQGRPPIGVEWDKQVVASADQSPYASVHYWANGITSSVRIEGGQVTFAQPVDSPRVFLEAGNVLDLGLRQGGWPAGPQTQVSLYASFNAKLLENIRKPFAIVVKDSANRVLYRARYAGISKKMEAEAKATRQQITRTFQLKPASGSGHPRECS